MNNKDYTTQSFRWLMLIISLSLSICHLSLSPVCAQTGTWKAYLSYYEPQQIVKGGHRLYVRASNGLYSYNLNDQSITTYDKARQLSDTHVRMIGWNQQTKKLIIVYENYNIDLLSENDEVTNLSAYYQKQMTENKTVNALYMYQQYAYLCTGFGLVKVNLQQNEISESYLLDRNIKAMGISNNIIYVQATDGTVLSANISNNLINPSSWTSTTTAPVDIFSTSTADWDTYYPVVKTLNPDGPHNNTFNYLRYKNGILYTTTIKWEEQAIVQQIDDDDNWLFYEKDISETIGHRFIGFTAVDVDPNDESHIICSGQTGVYEYKNGEFIKEYTNDNSPLKTAATVGNNNKDYVIVSDGAFDSQGNYWCLNSISPSTSLLQLTPDGEWIDHHNKELMLINGWSMDDMRSIQFDTDGTLWFCNNYYRKPAVVKYDTTTKELTLIDNFQNQDNTAISVHGVKCIAFDLFRNLWVGTDNGLLELERTNIDSQNTSFFTQVKVARNDGSDFADYLLSNLQISAIAIDGANRKWIGTEGNGIYLISADNTEQIHHFTVDNSPLLSNDVKSIAINPKSGRVYIGTEDGLCSFMSDATASESSPDDDNIYAFPNPVTPQYKGLITIHGLTFNASVKIVSSSGKLITEGRSNGGTFTWNGCDSDGRPVASGVYMAVSATEDGSKGSVCKIAIVR